MLSSQLHRRVTGTAIVVRVIMEVMIPHLHMTCTIVVSGKRWRTRRMVFMVAGLTMSHFVLSLSLPISTSSLIHSAATQAWSVGEIDLSHPGDLDGQVSEYIGIAMCPKMLYK